MNGACILAVDDDKDIMAALSLVLQIHDYRFVTAFTGSQAVTLAKKFRPKLVLLDLNLPDMNGIEVARTLRERENFDTTIILLSASEQIQEASRAIGAPDCIKKPFAMDELLSVVKKYLAN